MTSVTKIRMSVFQLRCWVLILGLYIYLNLGLRGTHKNFNCLICTDAIHVIWYQYNIKHELNA